MEVRICILTQRYLLQIWFAIVVLLDTCNYYQPTWLQLLLGLNAFSVHCVWYLQQWFCLCMPFILRSFCFDGVNHKRYFSIDCFLQKSAELDALERASRLIHFCFRTSYCSLLIGGQQAFCRDRHLVDRFVPPFSEQGCCLPLLVLEASLLVEWVSYVVEVSRRSAWFSLESSSEDIIIHNLSQQTV